MKSGNTVLLPIKAKMINPLTGAEEVMDTGQMQEYGYNAAGRRVPVGPPITMPVYSAEQVETIRRADPQAIHGDNGYAKATIYTPDSRPLAAHYARPGETAGAAATRLGDAAARFEVVPGTNRAEVRIDAGHVPFLRGNH